MLRAIRKWLAIWSYKRKLGTKLRERYGRARKYTSAQVKRTVEDCGFNTDFVCYALCLYCTPSDFAAYHEANGEACSYSEMTSEIFGESRDSSHTWAGESGHDVSWSHDGHGSSHDSHGAYDGTSSDGSSDSGTSD